MNFDDEIVLKGQLGPNGLPLTQSVNESYRSGIEFDIDWSIADCITLTSNMALDRSRIDAAGEEFSPVITPQFLANQGIRYVAGNFSFDTNIHLQSSSYLDLANSSKLNDYYVVDLGAQYQFDNLLINFQLNNLFDRNYFSNGYIDGFGESRFFVQAPTNTYLTLTWKL